ncbi:hypothetical protein BpHYR1_028533 [Brachionus plicatilis]|uniref:Uncharacterized protein n=1 Tax=Brachionus plicatilis TaxID=10195 RepID=A0A3M7Q1Q5_BRAPC|nr:hypothetical protein BpHYR1_028533 [Brachionus plicatilis]
MLKITVSSLEFIYLMLHHYLNPPILKTLDIVHRHNPKYGFGARNTKEYKWQKYQLTGAIRKKETVKTILKIMYYVHTKFLDQDSIFSAFQHNTKNKHHFIWPQKFKYLLKDRLPFMLLSNPRFEILNNSYFNKRFGKFNQRKLATNLVNYKLIITDKKSKKMSETLSKESVLEDRANQTLEDVDQDWTDVLKPANEIRKRGKAITYDLFKSFEDFNVILKEIKDGTINGNTWIFKSQDGDKHRFYCKYLKHGCRAALYLQLTDGSKDDEHTNHPNDEEDIRKIDPIINK